MHCLRRVTISTTVALLFGACTTTTPPPPATWDGLELRATAESGALYVRPGSHARAYRTVMIDPVAVSTDKNWMPVRDVRTGAIVERHPVSSDEIQYIEDSIGPAFRRIFVEELTAGGYSIVDQPRDDTLRVTAGLANVFIDSPSAGMGRLRSEDTMTLVMDLSDPSTGVLLARVVDTKQGKMGLLEAPNTIATNLNFQRAVRDWAGRLRDALDDVNVAPSRPEDSSST